MVRGGNRFEGENPDGLKGHLKPAMNVYMINLGMVMGGETELRGKNQLPR